MNFGTNLKMHFRANGPTYMMGGGLIAMTVSAIAAAIISTKIEEKTRKDKEELVEIKKRYDALKREEYSEKEYATDNAKACGKLVGTYVKNYALPAIGYALGAGLVIKSHADLNTKYVGVAGELAATTSIANGIVTRMREKLGNDEANKIIYDLKEKEVVEMKDGTGKSVITTVSGIDPNIIDENEHFGEARVFDWRNINYDKTGSEAYNIAIINDKIAHLNQKFKINGVLFVNDIYDEFGFTRDKNGWKKGLLLDLKDPKLRNRVDIEVTRVEEPDAHGNPRVAWIIDPMIDGWIEARWDHYQHEA